MLGIQVWPHQIPYAWQEAIRVMGGGSKCKCETKDNHEKQGPYGDNRHMAVSHLWQLSHLRTATSCGHSFDAPRGSGAAC